jgi:hypothetical protein
MISWGLHARLGFCLKSAIDKTTIHQLLKEALHEKKDAFCHRNPGSGSGGRFFAAGWGNRPIQINHAY